MLIRLYNGTNYDIFTCFLYSTFNTLYFSQIRDISLLSYVILHIYYKHNMHIPNMFFKLLLYLE